VDVLVVAVHSDEDTFVLLAEDGVVLVVVVAPTFKGLGVAVVPTAGGGGDELAVDSVETAVAAAVDDSDDLAEASVRCCCSRCNLVVTPKIFGWFSLFIIQCKKRKTSYLLLECRQLIN